MLRGINAQKYDKFHLIQNEHIENHVRGMEKSVKNVEKCLF